MTAGASRRHRVTRLRGAEFVGDRGRFGVPLKQSPQARLDVLAERLAHRVVRLAQARQRLGVGQAGLLHDDGRLDVPVRHLQQPVGIVVLEAGDDVHDAAGAILELLRSGLHVDHQVAVGLARPDHRAGRQHVQHELGGGAGLESGRTSDDLGADAWGDRQVDERLQLGSRDRRSRR